MSSNKAEKTKEEDELSASISKSMTIDKLKEDLRNANINISGLKKKADYVNLYISNGLHKGASIASLKEESVRPVEETKTEAIVVRAEPKAISVIAAKPKEELILSLITISAHGEETFRWTRDYADISNYYKKNVRVYSRGCFPGVATVWDQEHVLKSIHDSFNIFKKNPESATEEVMAEYTGTDRDYYIKFLDGLNKCRFKDEIMGKNILENKGRCGGLITYLSNKIFTILTDEEARSFYPSETDFKKFIASRGINVSDIRLKITASRWFC